MLGMRIKDSQKMTKIVLSRDFLFSFFKLRARIILVNNSIARINFRMSIPTRGNGMRNLLGIVSKYRIKQYMKTIRTKKPSLVEYYAMYLSGKNLRELTKNDVESAERELIPLVLKYYLDLRLTWEDVVENLLRDLREFYLYFCKRKKRLNVETVEDILRLVRSDYSIREMLRWCKSPVPRTRHAFRALLKRTRPEDIQRAIELDILSREEILEVYRKRKRKLIPAIKEAIEDMLKPEIPSKESKRVSRKKRVRRIDVFRAYLDVTNTNQDSVSYLKRLEIEHEFKVLLAKIWFTSKNRDERLNRLDEVFPGLTDRVKYTKLWEYVRTEIDEFILVEALSREQIANYLERNKWRLGRVLRGKFERALGLLERSYM